MHFRYYYTLAFIIILRWLAADVFRLNDNIRRFVLTSTLSQTCLKVADSGSSVLYVLVKLPEHTARLAASGAIDAIVGALLQTTAAAWADAEAEDDDDDRDDVVKATRNCWRLLAMGMEEMPELHARVVAAGAIEAAASALLRHRQPRDECIAGAFRHCAREKFDRDLVCWACRLMHALLAGNDDHTSHPGQPATQRAVECGAIEVRGRTRLGCPSR